LKTESANSLGYWATQGRDNRARVPPAEFLFVCSKSRGANSSRLSITISRFAEILDRRLESPPGGSRLSRRSQCFSCWRTDFARNLDSVRAPADSVDGERETHFMMRSRISRSSALSLEAGFFVRRLALRLSLASFDRRELREGVDPKWIAWWSSFIACRPLFSRILPSF
jgi:hypothetical protein